MSSQYFDVEESFFVNSLTYPQSTSSPSVSWIDFRAVSSIARPHFPANSQNSQQQQSIIEICNEFARKDWSLQYLAHPQEYQAAC